MPQNKKESLIYTVLMCFVMVLWMSMYNVALHMGGFSAESVREGWMGFPLAYICALCLDWFVVSGQSSSFSVFRRPRQQPVKKGNRCVLLHGGSHGHFHVSVWRSGNVYSYRSMEAAAPCMAHQYSEKLCNGSAFSAAGGRARCQNHIPPGISCGDDCMRERLKTVA